MAWGRSLQLWILHLQYPDLRTPSPSHRLADKLPALVVVVRGLLRPGDKDALGVPVGTSYIEDEAVQATLDKK